MQSADGNSYLFTTSHTNLTMSPPPPSSSHTRLLSCISASFSPSVSLLSLVLYSPPPTVPSSLLTHHWWCLFSSRLASFLLWKARQGSDILIISCPHPSPYLSFSFSFIPPPSPLSFLLLFLLHFCLPPLLLLLGPRLSACYRLECEFPLFKVLGWAVSWEIPEQVILVNSE